MSKLSKQSFDLAKLLKAAISTSKDKALIENLYKWWLKNAELHQLIERDRAKLLYRIIFPILIYKEIRFHKEFIAWSNYFDKCFDPLNNQTKGDE